MRVPGPCNGERIVSSTDGAGTTGFHIQENKYPKCPWCNKKKLPHQEPRKPKHKWKNDNRHQHQAESDVGLYD